MTKRLIPLLVLFCLLGSCAPAPASPTQTPTETITATAFPSPTPTPEPTAIPETPEQMHLRLAETVVANGWSPNNESTWTMPGGMAEADAAYLNQMISINADPNTKTKEQLVSYNAFLTLVRKEQLSRDLYSADSTIAGNTNNALDKFLASGFLTAVPTPEQVVFLKVNQSDFRAWLDTLTPDQVSSLEMLWCIENKAAFMPSHEEQKTWVRNYSANVASGNILGPNEWENGLPKYGWYGLDLSPLDQRGQFPVRLYGEELIWQGNLGNGNHMGDYGGILNLPYERNGILILMKGHDGTLVKIPFVTPLSGDEVNTPYYIYGIDGSRFDPNIPVWARLYSKQGSEEILTYAHLLDNLQWPPRMVWFGGPWLSYTNETGTSIFSVVFDQKTNLSVLGNADGQTDGEGIQFANPTNTWSP